MTFADFTDKCKNFGGAVSALLVAVDSKYPMLPVNPMIRRDLDYVAALLGAVAGFGAYQFAKRSGKLVLGWVFLALTVLALLATLVLTGHAVLSPEVTSLTVRIAYVLFFLALGGSIGGFLK